jgi:hypothetical protein
VKRHEASPDAPALYHGRIVAPNFDGPVRGYIARFRERRLKEQRWFAIQRTLDHAIERAAMAVSPAGKRLNHQRRIPGAVLRAWTKRLLQRRVELQKATTFEQLHDIIAALGADHDGIGKLTVYDTATRLAAFLRLEPERVYLHAGTREGAVTLGFHKRHWLLPHELPESFRQLMPDEIEDCFIYKREIAAIARGEGSTRRKKPSKMRC